MVATHYVSRISLQREKVESFDRYPFSLAAVRTLDHLDLHPKLTFFIGENGSGKSTLLEAIAVSLGFNAEGGTKNFRFGTRASHSILHLYLRTAKGVQKPRDGFFLRAESFFNVATEIANLDSEPNSGRAIIASVLQRSEVDLCLKDPGFEVDLVVDADLAALTKVWLGDTRLGDAMRSGLVRLKGPSGLVRAFPGWLALSGFAGVERPRAAVG